MAAKEKPRPHPWLPANYSYLDVMAIQAVATGVADEKQQMRAIDWIINEACRTYENPFRSDDAGGARDSDFASGKMFVGQQIVKLTNYPPALLAKLRNQND